MVRRLPTHLCDYDADYLLTIAHAIIQSPDNFFSNFRTAQVKSEYFYPTLISYTERRIEREIYEQLRRKTGLQTIGRSDLGLASRASQIRVKEALEYGGYSQPKLSQYLQVWRCFQEFKQAVKYPVNEYQNQDFQEMADLYHQRHPEAAHINEKIIKEWLNRVGAAIRRFLNDQYPYTVSIDNPNNDNWLENRQQSPVIQDLLLLEEDSFFNEYSERLKERLNNLLQTITNAEDRKLLFCSHGLKLKQREIALEFKVKQYQISRRLAQLYQKELYPKIVAWIDNNMTQEFPPDSISAESSELNCSEALKYLTILLDEYYETQITQILKEYSQTSEYSQLLVQKIQERFNIVLNQYLESIVLLWLENRLSQSL
jgi:RNA polymerase sigma factor (sigma-70 family)